MKNYVDEEVSFMNLKDLRLKKRLSQILEDISDQPNLSIPAACQTHSKTKGAYRFFSNDNVNVEELRSGFYKSTLNKIKNLKTVLFSSDMTSLNYGSHKKLSGMGPLRNFRARGFVKHTSLASTVDGIPIGIMYEKVWGRDPNKTGLVARSKRKLEPLKNRESYVWIETIEQINAMLPKQINGIITCDSGADSYNLWSHKKKSNIDLLVRSRCNRELADGSRLYNKLEQIKPSGTLKIEIKKGSQLKGRLVSLDIRFCNISIVPTKYIGVIDQGPVNLYVVRASEQDFANCKKSIDWVLLTTIKVDSVEKAIECVRWYKMRWLIERYHYVLKSGCQVEELQLEQPDRIEKAVTIYSSVACRLLNMTYLSRKNSKKSAEKILTQDQWEALCVFISRKPTPPKKPPTIKEAILMLAKIGGFLARKGDGEPGVKIIWQGLRRIDDITDTYTIFKGDN